MQDIFQRQRLQSLSGTTVYDQYKDDPAIALVGNDTWTTIFSITDSEYQVFTAYKLSVDADGGDLSNVQMRMLAAPTGTSLGDEHKIFPHADSGEVLDGVVQHLKLGIKLQEHADFAIQVKGDFTTGAPTAVLDFLSVIFNPALNH